MSNNQPIYEKLKKKYHKTEPITNFKDLLDRAENIYKSRTAFKLKDKNNQIYNITYKQFKDDIVSLGTSFIENGLLNQKICVIMGCIIYCCKYCWNCCSY